MHVSLDASIAMLDRTPSTLRALVGNIDERWATPNYGPNTWSAKEVVAHLIYGERTDWLPRVRILLAHGETQPFAPFDRAGHAPLMTHALAELLDMFESERQEGLRTLRGLKLAESDLSKPGKHPALGPVTLGNLLATWVVHDLNHAAQICKAMAWQYRTEVGPWEEYLSILNPPNPR